MRVIFSAPDDTTATFRFLDSLHGAIINAWISTGLSSDSVIGYNSGNWSFGAVGKATRKGFILKSVVVGAEGKLEEALRSLEADSLRKQSINGDNINLSSWNKSPEMFPVIGETYEKYTLSAKLLSPLALSVRGKKGRWHQHYSEIGSQLQDAVNFRLSRLTGRTTSLVINPDKLYLKANPRHSHLVHTRAVRGGRDTFVVGMIFPLIISGSAEDLQSAWCLGIGEKNRYGFGCIRYNQS